MRGGAARDSQHLLNRPAVLGICKFPVLAWGLGIERLAMIRFGLSDIRDLYGTNLNELEKVPLCR